MNFAFNIMRINCILSRPFIPFTVYRIADALEINPKGWIFNVSEELKEVVGGTSVKPIGLLFKKIEDSEVAGWEHQFSGAGNHGATNHAAPNIS